MCEKLGHEYLSLDYNIKLKPDICVDILNWDYSTIPVPDFIWCSPDCLTWSRAHHRHRVLPDLKPLTPEAIIGEQLIHKTLEILNYFAGRNPALKFVIENPKGRLRFFPPMKALEYYTEIDYCQYNWGVGKDKGEPTACNSIKKRTSLWSNFELKLRPLCKKRQHKVWGHWKTGLVNRSSVPKELLEEILLQAVPKETTT